MKMISPGGTEIDAHPSKVESLMNAGFKPVDEKPVEPVKPVKPAKPKKKAPEPVADDPNED